MWENSRERNRAVPVILASLGLEQKKAERRDDCRKKRLCSEISDGHNRFIVFNLGTVGRECRVVQRSIVDIVIMSHDHGQWNVIPPMGLEGVPDILLDGKEEFMLMWVR